MDDLLWILAIFGTIFWIVAFVLTARRWARVSSAVIRVDRGRWEIYAGEHHHQYVPDPMAPKIRGTHQGVSFEFITEITSRKDRAGNVTEWATSRLRATHRAAVPHGFRIRKASWGLTFASLFVGQRAIDVDEAYDKLRVECDDAEAANKLLDDPTLMRAILNLFVSLPHAVIHERAIEAPVPKLPTDLVGLDAHLDRITAVGKQLRALAPQVERPPQEGAPAPLKPLPTAAELPERRENLSGALRRVSQATSRASAGVQATSLKLRPYEYEVEVRVIDQAESRLGAPTGGRLVRGLLARSQWRVEIHFSPADNAAVDALKPTDVITGLVLIEDVRPVTQTVTCSAQTPPIVVTPAKAKAGEAPPG